MSLAAYPPKIFCRDGFADTIKKTHKILVVVNRQDTRLENKAIVLTKPPLKMYGITKERFISFTYSTVDEIPDEILTAHIDIVAVYPLLIERLVRQITQRFFTEEELRTVSAWKDKEFGISEKDFLNPDYKGLLLRFLYSEVYLSDNEILLDDWELDNYSVSWSAFEWETVKHDLDFIISEKKIQLGCLHSDDQFHVVAKYREEYRLKQIEKELEYRLKQEQKELEYLKEKFAEP